MYMHIVTKMLGLKQCIIDLLAALDALPNLKLSNPVDKSSFRSKKISKEQ